MSGIVAIVHLDGRPLEEEDLRTCAETLRHRGPDGTTVWKSGSQGLAFQFLRSTLESGPEVQPEGCPAHIAVAFDGRLDNREQLREMLPRSPLCTSDATDAAFAIATYMEFAERFAEHLKGDYALVLCDAAARRTVLASDIMAIRPLCYARQGNTFLAASEAKAILAHPNFETRPDEDALADLILGGNFYELELTCFKDVLRLLPGNTLLVQDGELRSFQHKAFDTTKQIRFRSVDEYAHALRELFEQAVRRRFRSSHPVAVAVSGGLDSSGIFCMAETLRARGERIAPSFAVSKVFSDGSGADESAYLPYIEREYEIPIKKLSLTQLDFVLDPPAVWHSESPVLQWDATLMLMSAAAENGCRSILDGFFGDQMLTSDAYLLEWARHLHWMKVNRELASIAHWTSDADPRRIRKEFWRDALRDVLPRALFPPLRWIRRRLGSGASGYGYPRWYSTEFRDRAFARSHKQRPVSPAFGSKHAEATFRYTQSSFRLFNVEQMNKFAAMYKIDRAYPFMDSDLVQFIMSIPGEVVTCGGVFKGLYRRAMQGVLPEEIRLRNWKADYTSLNAGAANRILSRPQPILRRDSSIVKHGFGDAATIEKEFTNYQRMLTAEHSFPTRAVSMAAGFELWLSTYFGN